jgi:hypothetical protein
MNRFYDLQNVLERESLIHLDAKKISEHKRPKPDKSRVVSGHFVKFGK